MENGSAREKVEGVMQQFRVITDSIGNEAHIELHREDVDEGP